MKISHYLRVSVAALAIAGLMVVACSDDKTDAIAGTDGGGDAQSDVTVADTSTPIDAAIDTSKPSTPGITVNVTSTLAAGSAVLSIAVFKGSGLPVLPPPAGATQVPNATFPVSRKITVAPGTYVVTTYLDRGGNNVQGPGPEDPRQVEAKVVTFAGTDLVVDLVLDEPPDAGDGG